MSVTLVLHHCAKGKMRPDNRAFQTPTAAFRSPESGGKDEKAKGGDKEDNKTPKVTRTCTPPPLSPTLVFRENFSPVKPVFRLTLCEDKTESQIH